MEHALDYIDDIVIFSQSTEEHLHHLESILQLINKARKKLKLKKCFLTPDAIDYRGHVITPPRLHITTKTINAVRDLRCPMAKPEMRSFLGLCNVYQRFVPKFSRLAAPLMKRLKKVEPALVDLNDERRTVDNLKQELITAPVLPLPRPEGQLVTEADACEKQAGCVLLPEQESGEFCQSDY